MNWLYTMQAKVVIEFSPRFSPKTWALCIQSLTFCNWSIISVSGSRRSASVQDSLSVVCDFLHLIHDSVSSSLFSACVWPFEQVHGSHNWSMIISGLWFSLLLGQGLSQLVNDYLWSMVFYSWPMTLFICYLTLCIFSVTPCIQLLIIIVFQPVLPFGGACWAWMSTSSVFFVPGKWVEKGWQKYSGICGRWSFSFWTLKCICFFRKKQKTDKNRDHAFVMSFLHNCFTTLHFEKKKERKKRKLIF